MKKAVLGCAGILLCLGLLAGCDTDLVGPGLAYHDPNTGTEVEPGPVIPTGDDPDGDGDTGDEPDTSDKDTGPDPVEDPDDGGDDGDGDTSETYTLAVTTSTIINNFTTNDDEPFTIGEGDNPATTCMLDGYTFDFGNAFSIAFNHEEGGNDTSARLWSDGIRVYTGDDFTIKPLGDWLLSKIVLEYTMSNTTNLSLTVKSGDTVIATEEGTSSSYTLEDASSYTEITAGPTRDTGTGGHAKFTSIEVTCVK